MNGFITSPMKSHLLVAALISGVTLLRVGYLAYACPLDLAPDEAHYWDWSRHLDWSYYSKGPLVAYLIRAGCELAGGWSDALLANQMLAVRLPAVVCGGLLLVSLYVLTLQVFGRGGLAVAVVAVALTLPLVWAGASVMTIDAPYTCCWGWALVLGFQAFLRRSWWAWLGLGLIIGLGILAKYTMILWPFSAMLFLLLSAERRQLLLHPGFGLMLALVLFACLPIVIWNAQHDWVSVRHVGMQAGAHGASRIRWHGPFVYLGTQAALLLGFWFVAWLAAMTKHRPWRESNPGLQYLWWMSAPTFVFFLLFSFKTPEQPNWPVTAYLSGLVLTAGFVSDQLQSSVLWYRRLTQGCLATACMLGVAVTFAVHRSDLLQPVLAVLAGPPTPESPLPMRRLDPTCRLRGWRFLAAQIDELRGELRRKGVEPILAGSSWTLPGELAFYCAGQPTVYSLGLALGDRHSQYDLWRPNPLADSHQFLGRTFLYVGPPHPYLIDAFDCIETPRQIIYREGDQPIAQWTVTVCHGYRGFTESVFDPAKRSF